MEADEYSYEKSQNSAWSIVKLTCLSEYVLPRELPNHTSYPLSARMQAANMEYKNRQYNQKFH